MTPAVAVAPRRLWALAPEVPPARFVFHPMALASSFVLNLFIEAGVSPYAMFRSLAIAVLGAGLATVAASLLLRDRHKGGALASLVLVVLVGWSSPLLLGAAIALLVLVVVLLGRITGAGVPWAKATYALNVFGFVMLLALIVKVVTTGSLGQIAADLRQGGPLSAAATAPRVDGPPDIYIVLLDAYPRADTLQRVFDYDNEPFLAALEARGFDVSRRSRSNYSITSLTLTSMFNMRHVAEIPEMGPLLRREREPQPTLRNLVTGSSVLRVLRERGYEIVTSPPGYEEVGLRQADVYLDDGQINEFEVALLRLTPLTDVLSKVQPEFIGDQLRARIRSNLEHLATVAGSPGRAPRLTLVHVPSPHAPIVFGRDGSSVHVDPRHPYEYYVDGSADRDRVIERYRQQLPYLNEIVLGALDRVVAAHGDGAVVVLMSDHGTLAGLDETEELRLQERVSNFFAARTPRHPQLFDEGVTPVNVFPAILEAYLGLPTSRATDRSFVSPNVDLFDFVEISNPDADAGAPRPRREGEAAGSRAQEPRARSVPSHPGTS